MLVSRIISRKIVSLTGLSLIFACGLSEGATRTRTASGTDLNAAGSWSGAVPSINDIADWGASSALSGTFSAATNWQGINIGAVTGAVHILAGNQLTLGFNGINMSSAANNLSIASNLSLREKVAQTWNVASGRTLSLSGNFTRGTASTLNIRGAGTVNATGSGLNNDATGIIGPWVTYGTGADTSYATRNSITGNIEAYASTVVGLNGLVDSTKNYEIATSGTLVDDISAGGSFANTLRYTGGSGGLTGNLTVNGILNAGSSMLTLAGSITVGESRELVFTVPDSTRNIWVASNIHDHGSGASDVIIAHTTANSGNVTFAVANDYTGTTYVQAGILEVRHSQALGSTAGGTVVYTSNRGSLRLANNVTIAETLTFTGGDPNGTSSSGLVNGTGNNTITGQILLEENLRIGGSGADNTLNIEGGIVSIASVNRQLVFNPNSSVVNIRNNSVTLGSGGSFYFDQVGTVNLEVGGNVWGRTIVSGGKLVMHGTNYLPTAAVLQVGVSYGNSTGVLDLNGFSQSTGRLEQAHSAPGTITSATAANLTLNQGGTDTIFNGFITGEVSLTKAAVGTLSLGASNTYKGETVISGGNLRLVQAAATTKATASDATTATITLTDTTGLHIGQAVTGTGVLAGTYITAISGNNITVNRAPNSGPITGTLSFGALSGELKESTLNYNGQGGQLQFGTLMTSTELGGLKGNQNLALTNLSSAAVALSIGGNHESNTYSGVLSGSGSILKKGNGVWTLTNANTYTGGTTVVAGTLLANNVSPGSNSATGTGSVQTLAGSGAKIGGTGSITGGSAQNITLGAGTFLLVGNSHGVNSSGAQKLTLGSSASPTNVAITLAGTLQFDLFSSQVGTPLIEADLLELRSTSAINLTGGTVEVSAPAGTSGWAIGDTWKLIDWTGSTTTGDLSLSMMPDVSGLAWTSFKDATGFYVQLTAVPEPTRWMMILLAFSALGMRRKRA